MSNRVGIGMVCLLALFLWMCNGDDDDLEENDNGESALMNNADSETIADSESESVDDTASGTNDDGADFFELESALNSFVEETAGVDGAGAVVISRDDGVVFRETFGNFDEDRVYLVASASKIVTASVIMTLVDDGILDIETPLSALVSFAGPNDGLNMRQLLSNSSGLPGVFNADWSIYDAAYTCQFDPESTLLACAEEILNTDVGSDAVLPDTEFRYGGAQWQVAGGIAEAVSELSWAELVQEKLIEPCGLTSFGYTQVSMTAGFSYPSDMDGQISSVVSTDNPNMEAGVYATIDDYAKILSIHLNDGFCGWGDDATLVLDAESVEAMRIDYLSSYGGTAVGLAGLEGYGMGWWIDRDVPGLYVDEGIWGAMPWLDTTRGYAAFIALESNLATGALVMSIVKPLLEDIFDNAEEE